MTREEAEEYAKEMTYRDAVYNALQGKCIPYRKATFIKLYELLDKLEQEPCEDAISRLDMLDAIGHGTTYTSEELQGIIKALQPVNAQQWETCFDCPLSHGCPKIKGCTNEQAIEYASEMPNDCPLSAQPERKTDGDTISRQAAIDCLTATSLKKYDFILDARDKIKNLPPVTPQPKTGHWIFDEILDRHYYCSECKSMGVDYWDYCPNCGAKMEEVEE